MRLTSVVGRMLGTFYANGQPIALRTALLLEHLKLCRGEFARRPLDRRALALPKTLRHVQEFCSAL